MKRVIMGFNIFANDIGPYVSKVPEYSDSLRRWVKWYRTVVLSKNSFSNKNVNTSGMNTVTIDEKEHVNASTSTNTSIGSNYKNTSNDHVKLENIQKNKPLMKL
jgi:hypothetical protein